MSNILTEAQAKLQQKMQREGRTPIARVSDGIDAADLLSSDLAEPNYIVRPWIAEGVTLVCGRPKIGKTTLLRQIVIAVNTAAEVFGAEAQQVPCIFLSLEEGRQLFRKKLKDMCSDVESVRGVRLEFDWDRGAEGVERLRDWLKARKQPRASALVVIDSLTRFRVPPSQRGNAFVEDYNAVMLLAELCKEFPGLSVLLLHHTTKAAPDDPVAAISGTYGLTAAAENYLILLKQGDKYRLHAGGRLWEEDASDFEIQRDSGGWRVSGEWDDTPAPFVTKQQQTVLDLLKEGSKTNRTLAEKTGQSDSALSHMLSALSRRGLVMRVANGWGLAS